MPIFASEPSKFTLVGVDRSLRLPTLSELPTHRNPLRLDAMSWGLGECSLTELNVQTDDSQWPVPCTMIKGPFTPDSPGLMLDFLDSFSKRDEDYVHKIIVEHYSINMKVMKLLGQWQIKNRKTTAEHCRGVVICVENIKGFQLVLNSLLNITPTNFPIEIVNSKEEADVWAQERLHEKKKKRR